MSDFVPATPISPLRQRLIDDMNMRRFARETHRNYIRDVGRFATFFGARAQHDRGGVSARRPASSRASLVLLSHVLADSLRLWIW